MNTSKIIFRCTDYLIINTLIISTEYGIDEILLGYCMESLASYLSPQAKVSLFLALDFDRTFGGNFERDY